MKIPPAKVQCHDTGTGFHQAPGHKEVSIVAWSSIPKVFGVPVAITLPNFRGFFFQAHGFSHLATGEYSQSLLSKGVHAVKAATGIYIPPKKIKLLKQGLAISKPALGNPI